MRFPHSRLFILHGLLASAILAAGGVARAASHGTPTLSVHGAWMAEGNAGATGAPFIIRLSTPVLFDVSVAYVSESRSALAGSDFEAVEGGVVLPAGSTETTVFVPVYGDRILEMNETFALRLTASSSVDIAESTAVDTIANDERTTFERSDMTFTMYSQEPLPPAWGDFDGDGDSDLPLHENTGGGFDEIPGFRALLAGGRYHGGSWCDYDRDGKLDFALLPYAIGDTVSSRMRMLKRGKASGFIDVAQALGMDFTGNGETAVWGDFDGDGWPDLFTPFYAHLPPFRSFLWHNQGDGTFVDVGEAAGVALSDVPEAFKPEGAQAVDWNDDGHLDLYCASHLFVNDGNAVFTDVRQAVGLPKVFDEGAQFADYDGDGDFDLYLRTASGPRLFRNDAGQFVEATGDAGLAPRQLFWGDRFVDVDNDGDLDLYIAGQHATACLMLNRGNGTFEADTAFDALGLSGSLSAWADVDQDGDLDVVLDEGGRTLIRNRLEAVDGAERSYLRVRVLDSGGHESSHGATVRLRGPDGVQLRTVDGGSGYIAQCEYPVHFAAPGSGPYALEIEYPSAPGPRAILDGTVNPALASVDPDSLPYRSIDVWSDGRIVPHAPHLAGVVPGTHSSPSALGAPWPLPARLAVTLPFVLGRAATRTELAIHDVSGRLVRRLDTGARPAGPGRVTWNLDDARGVRVPVGIYFAVLELDGQRAGHRAIVVTR